MHKKEMNVNTDSLSPVYPCIYKILKKQRQRKELKAKCQGKITRNALNNNNDRGK